MVTYIYIEADVRKDFDVWGHKEKIHNCRSIRTRWIFATHVETRRALILEHIDKSVLQTKHRTGIFTDIKVSTQNCGIFTFGSSHNFFAHCQPPFRILSILPPHAMGIKHIEELAADIKL